MKTAGCVNKTSYKPPPEKLPRHLYNSSLLPQHIEKHNSISVMLPYGPCPLWLWLATICYESPITCIGSDWWQAPTVARSLPQMLRNTMGESYSCGNECGNWWIPSLFPHVLLSSYSYLPIFSFSSCFSLTKLPHTCFIQETVLETNKLTK